MKFLEESFEKLNIPFDNSVIEMFEQYMDGILEWNKKINLTAITDREEFISKHFVDSVLSYNFREYIDADSIIDIGTGAGFPGIPLAIVSPDKKFVLADSLNSPADSPNDTLLLIQLKMPSAMFFISSPLSMASVSG